MRIYKCPKCNHLEEYRTSNEENDERRFIAACHAMQGFIAGVVGHPDHNGDIPPVLDLTRTSILFADALIAELEKK